MIVMWIFGLMLLLFISQGDTKECSARQTNSTSIICVCNSTYCDTLPQLETLLQGTYQYFVSTQDGLRLSKSNGSFSNGSSINPLYITVDRSVTHQTIFGFGGAFSDSAGYNIAQLPEAAQENLLRAYFSTDGAEYNLGRVPIGGTDFSIRGYTYADDDSNGTLDDFALQFEDYNYKIPYIKKATDLTGGALKLVAAAWSPPVWMKTIASLTTPSSFLKQEYYQLWAEYYIKFFESYAENNVSFWGLSTQNEPYGSLVVPINTLSWTVDQLITWLTNNLGPTIRASQFSDLDILIHDDHTVDIGLVQKYYNNPEALNYINGVGVHWYTSFVIPDEILQTAKTDKKDVYLLLTESCAGFLSSTNLEEAVVLGSWDRAYEYAKQILSFLKQDSVGWIDWNLVLDEQGGPSWSENYVDAAIIANVEAGEFYKQPVYYVLAHFSKYIPRGSLRIDASASILAIDVATVAFLRPDGTVTVILHNEGLFSKNIVVYDNDIDGYIDLELPRTAIATLVYK